MVWGNTFFWTESEMTRYVHFFINAFIMLILPIAGLCQEQEFDGRKRGVGGVIEGHTVSAVQKAYGSEYGNLVNEFYNVVHDIDGNKDSLNTSRPAQLDAGSLNQYSQSRGPISKSTIRLYQSMLNASLLLMPQK